MGYQQFFGNGWYIWDYIINVNCGRLGMGCRCRRSCSRSHDEHYHFSRRNRHERPVHQGAALMPFATEAV